MSYRHRQDAQRDAKDACGTCIRSENRSKRSTRTDMTFVHLRSTKSRGHLSRITTPGLTSRRVAPRVMHSPPPALAARNEKKQSLRGENIRAGGGRMRCGGVPACVGDVVVAAPRAAAARDVALRRALCLPYAVAPDAPAALSRSIRRATSA